MTFQLLTCPETGELEMVEYDDSPVGMLLESCSRFRPATNPRCPRTCSRGRVAASEPTIATGADDTTAIEPAPMRPFVLEARSLLRRR